MFTATQDKKNLTFGILLTVVALLGMAAILFSTRWGAGITADSVDYLVGARTLLTNGQFLALGEMKTAGQLTYSTTFGPLLSLFLASLGRVFASDPLIVARIFDAWMFGLNAVLIGVTMFLFTARSVWISLIAVFFFITNTIIIRVHVWIMSEPLFYFFAILTLVFVAIYCQSGKRTYIIAGALTAGLACLARHVGMSLLITGTTAILFVSRTKFTIRIRNAAFFLILGALPLGLWYLRNMALMGSMSNTNRQFAVHLISLQAIVRGVDTFAMWLHFDILPSFFGVIAVILLGVVVAAICLIPFGEHKTEQTNQRTDADMHKGPLAQLPHLLIIFFIAYHLTLYVSISFFDRFTGLNARILSPLLIDGVMLIMYAVYIMWRLLKGRRTIRSLLVIVGSIYVVAYSFESLNSVAQLSKDGEGLTSFAWQNSPGLQRVKTISAQTPVFSNAVDAIYLYTGKIATWLPIETNFYTDLPNPHYEQELSTLNSKMKNEKGVIVIFKNYLWAVGQKNINDLAALLPLEVIDEEQDAVFYAVKGTYPFLPSGT